MATEPEDMKETPAGEEKLAEQEGSFHAEYTPPRSEADELRALIEKQERQLNSLRGFLEEKGFDPDEVVGRLGTRGPFAGVAIGEKARKARDAGNIEEFFRDIVEARGEDPELRGVEIRFSNVNVFAVEKAGDERIHTVATEFKDMATGCCTKTEKHDRALVKDASGIFRPKTITLVLGPPGAGKTTLMKRLSGKLVRTSLKQSGKVLYNGYEGHRDDVFFLNKAVGYIDQHDQHLPALTVLETVQFAFESMVDERENGMENITAMRSDIGSVADNVVKLLGLEGCKDTIVGNEMLRGVSGGQKKRVTTAELLVGEFGAMFADEISTGLDAATTYDEISMLRAAARVFNITMVVSLLQPAPEVFDLFDDVLLLDKGQIVYHGPREDILGYFENLGFRLPPFKDVADYLQEVTTEDGQSYITDAEEGEVKHAPPKTTREFVARWQETSTSKAMSEELSVDAKPGTFPPGVQKEFCRSWSNDFKSLFGRAATLKLRDSGTIQTSMIQQVIVGGLVAALFSDLPDDAAQSRYGVLFLAMMAFALLTLEALPEAFAERDVFYKQRDASFFRTTAYTLSSSVVGLPQQIACIIIYSSIVYFSVGLSLSGGGQHFFIFLAIMVLLAAAMAHFFLNFVAFFSSHDVAIPLSSASIVFLVLFSGFVISEEEIDPWFIWIYYLNPMSHAFVLLAQNEFLSSSFDNLVEVGPGVFERAGDLYLDQQGITKDTSRSIIGFVVLLAYYVFLWITATIGFHFIRHMPHHSAETAAEVAEPTEDAGDQALSHGPYTGPSFREVATVDPDEGNKDKRRALEVDRVDLAWQDLSYTVELDKDNSLELLHNVTGYAKAGSCTALMGSSGAGKTTLMDVIAGRKTGGTITGKVFVNGHELDKQSFSRIIGYCEQMDIHQESLTFLESLRFSARLRLPQETTQEKIEEHLQEILTALDLDTHRDLQVAQASQEQAKRLTIAVELAANPSILFLDEPTSGLDARAAALVMRAIKQAAISGRAVVATIHQPSQAIFDQFDRLLLLKRGGRTVYFGELGPGGEDIVRYFSGVEGSPKYTKGTNPAVYMLDCIGAGTNVKEVAAFDEVWNRSSHRVVLDEQMDQAGLTKPGDAPVIEFEELFAANKHMQVRMCLWRAGLSYFRSPEYNVTRVLIGLFVGLLFGVVFVQQDYNDFPTAYSRITLVFMTAMFMGIIAFISALGPAFQQRAVYYRERAANMYTASAYNTSIGIAEMPYLAFIAFIFTVVYYFIVGFQMDAPHFFEYLLFVFLWVTMLTFYGQMLIAAMPTRVAAMAVGVGVIQIFNLFGGFLQPAPDIPEALLFLHYLSPLHYIFEGLLLSQFHDDDTELEILVPGEGAVNLRMSEFVDQQFSTFSRDHFIYDIFVPIAFIFVFRFGTFFCLAYVNHLKR